jgi:hypothetical protein
MMRIRRGVEVTIPEEWVGQVPSRKSLRNRRIDAKIKAQTRRNTHKFRKDTQYIED